jgi:3-phenylpropionate/trans-cinnamate dioxygenase ferredoxin reductase subunit
MIIGGKSMSVRKFKYVIVGAGLAGVSAIEGIRERDPAGAVLLIGEEPHLPYDRPPLSKKLWTGKKQEAEIYLHPREWYEQLAVELLLGKRVVDLDAAGRTVAVEGDRRRVGYEKLLLATGGTPRILNLPGADLPGIIPYRTLDDYRAVRALAEPGAGALVIGHGFIGAEMAAALSLSGVNVTMVYPGERLIPRVLPEGLGRALQAAYAARGIELLPGQRTVAFTREGDGIVAATDRGRTVKTKFVVPGIGISPSTELAAAAGLALGDGIRVDERMATSDPSIFAAGDNAGFVHPGPGGRRRLEHWDNAVQQGRHAGRSMTGALEPFAAMPYFFSDLFDFGFEAVGELDPLMQVEADWTRENDTGVLYYLRDGLVRGVMLCNVWDKIEEARELIRAGRRVRPEELRGAIR